MSFISTQLAEENIELSISNSFVTAKIRKDIITTKIVDEKFPDYNSVIPKENNKTLVIDKKVYLAQLEGFPFFPINLLIKLLFL